MNRIRSGAPNGSSFLWLYNYICGEGLLTIRKVYNGDNVIYFDRKNLYLGKS